MNRIQHGAEASVPHEHMILSDISYLADHDDRQHAADHHDDVAGGGAHKGEPVNDIHSFVGGEHEAPVTGHTGHHHHHQGETGGSMVVLGSTNLSQATWHNQKRPLLRERIPFSALHSLPERPPRSLAIRA